MFDICLLNASNPINTQIEWDSYVDYRDGLLFDGPKILKMSRSWHSIPASLGTEFFVYNKPGWEGCFKYKNIILLVNRDLLAVYPLVKKLKFLNKNVLIGFHENLQDFLLFPNERDMQWLPQFLELVKISDGQWNVIPQAEEFFLGLHNKPIYSCLHAVPYDEWKHGLTIPIEQRKDILIGTRTFNQRLNRNTLVALSIANDAAKSLNANVSYLFEDGGSAEQMTKYLRSINLEKVNAIKGPFKYEEWLAFIAKHRIVVHCDMVQTLGQIVSDAALVEVPCEGGLTDLGKITATDTHDLSHLKQDIIETYKKGTWAPGAIKRLKDSTSFETIRNKVSSIFKAVELEKNG